MKRIFIHLFFSLSFFIPCSAQIINTIADTSGAIGYSGDGGPAFSAEFLRLIGIKLDKFGNIYIVDEGNFVVRKINSSGIISTFAGNGVNGYSGDGGNATAAELQSAIGVGVDDSGNVYIAEGSGVRRVNTLGIISTFAGNGTPGYTGDGGQATAAEIGGAEDVAADDSGNIYIADFSYHVIRKVNTSGIISTFAGNGYARTIGGAGAFSGDGGPATAAELNHPAGVVVDYSGNVYIADFDNCRIRIVNASGIINTFAGDSALGYSGDGGQAISAELAFPTGVATDDSGNVYIVDNGNSRIRKVNTFGIINTFAGNGIQGYSGNGGPATNAEIHSPYGIGVDTSGNIYFSDNGNRVRKVTVVLSVFANTITNASCNGGNNGSANIFASEGTNPYTYSWFPYGGGNSIATGLGAGTYTVMVTDSNNLKGSATVTITQPTAIGILASVNTNISCNGGNNGSASSIVSGGTVPYTYLWSDASSQTTVSATGLLAGIYTLTVTDNNGCTASAMVSISQPTAIIPSIIEYAGIKCNGDSDAVVYADATGGSGFYAYSWSNASSQATALATGLSVGNYTITVTDNNGCSGTSSTTITQPSVLNVVADSINEIGGSCNGSAWVMVTGGTPLYTYLWTGGLTTDTITNQCTGNYCSIVTDANGCIDSVCVNIDVSTGTNELIIDNGQLTIYPNPNNGIFTVTFGHAELVSASQTIIEIYSIFGEKVYNATLKQVQGDYLINLTGQSSGVYFYRIIEEDGSLVGSGKIIIDK